MEEYPVSGIGALVPAKLGDLVAWPRNRETLSRLAAIAERVKPTELSD